ncbi:MAG: bifunctional oligoribonuclease/PAP phosphatase NrnA [Bacteroidaceae bacterium]|nr:bifunctional oligoribonuclease/PAP phosphatase NrnA [Bacteroidaceae bacterium]
MFDLKIDTEKIDAIREIIAKGDNFAVLVHTNPDGDAIGSSTALAHYLRKMGKVANVIVPNAFPDFLMWLPSASEIAVYDSDKERCDALLKDADAIFCLDFNSLSRIDAMADVVASLDARRVLIDHHLNPDDCFDVKVSETKACSTAELVYRVVEMLGPAEALDVAFAEAVYTGMMTDTGNFAYASNRKDIYQIIANLMQTGIDKDIIYRRVFYNYSVNRMKLLGFAMYDKLKVYPSSNAALLTLTYKEMRRFCVAKGDTEGLVNMPLQIKGVRFSCMMREELPGKINVSLRSVDDFPCNKVAAEFFGGGGHLNASGGEVYGTMEYAVERFKAVLAKYKEELTR